MDHRPPADTRLPLLPKRMFAEARRNGTDPSGDPDLQSKRVRRVMKTRTLIANKYYFGLDPRQLCRGAERVISRVDGLPPGTARVNAATLREDFGLDMPATLALLHALAGHRMLQPVEGRAGDFRLTDKFREFAQAHIVPPLHRDGAKKLLDEACRLAERINDGHTRNPLQIDLMAVSGSYMSRGDKIAEIKLWPVVRPRVRMRAPRFQSAMNGTEAAREIRTALCAISPFLVVHVVTDMTAIERPFSVPFRADDGGTGASPSASMKVWGISIRRPLSGR